MGLFKHKQSQVIEYSGNNQKLLEIIDANPDVGKNDVVIVPPTHTALIVSNGSIVNVSGGGEVPLFEKGVSVRSLKVIYISKTAKITINWGTKVHERIPYEDPQTHKLVSVGAFGVMDVKVSNPQRFYLELVASFGSTFKSDDLQERIRTLVINDTFRTIGSVLNEKKLRYIDFVPSKYDIQTQVGNMLSSKFDSEFGFSVSNFIIENINITKEQEDEIKRLYEEQSAHMSRKAAFDRDEEEKEWEWQAEERETQRNRQRKEAIVGDRDLDDAIYQAQTARERDMIDYARKNRHEDEDRQWAREDRQRESGERITGNYFDAMKEVAKSEASGSSSKPAGNAGFFCNLCGTPNKPDAKFCAGCGAALQKEDVKGRCPHCGVIVDWGVSFCPACGCKLK